MLGSKVWVMSSVGSWTDIPSARGMVCPVPEADGEEARACPVSEPSGLPADGHLVASVTPVGGEEARVHSPSDPPAGFSAALAQPEYFRIHSDGGGTNVGYGGD